MVKRCRGPVNRLLMLRRGNVFAQNWGKGICAKSVGHAYGPNGPLSSFKAQRMLFDLENDRVHIVFSNDVAGNPGLGWSLTVDGGPPTISNSEFIGNELVIQMGAPINSGEEYIWTYTEDTGDFYNADDVEDVLEDSVVTRTVPYSSITVTGGWTGEVNCGVLPVVHMGAAVTHLNAPVTYTPA